MNRNARSIIVAILVLLANGGCTDTGERGFKSSQPDFMNELKVALTKSGVPFREDKDGFIRYQSKYEEAVSRVRDNVEKEISGGVVVRYEDNESRDYLKSLLSSQEMKYRVEAREDGEWIRWYPQSEAQQKEIEMKVVQHNFDLQREKSGSRCMEEKSPSNKSLNKDAAQTSRRAC
jgi:hypothetical protein